MYRARYQYGSFGSLWIPRAKLIQSEEDNFIDRGSANPGPPRSWEYYEKKYGKPDESNVEGYWIDDEIEVETEKPTGKERERQQELERERDYTDFGPSREDYQEYLDDRLDRLDIPTW